METTAKTPLSIFEIRTDGEKEWVAARSLIHALQVYCSTTSIDLVEFEQEDEIAELPRDKWKEYKVKNQEYDETDPDDWKEKTFEEVMNKNPIPDIIAGTNYE